MNSSYNSATAKRIEQGRSLRQAPYATKMVDTLNFATLFRERVTQNPSKEFLTFVPKSGEITQHTYAGFYARVCQLANLLLSEFDIQLNDRVSSVAYNHEDTVTLMFACFMVGACYVPINAGEDDDRLVFVHNNAEVKAMFVMPEYVERITALKGQLETVQYFVQMNGDEAEGFESLTDLMATSPVEFEFDDRATLDSDALIVYTSGTTGTPKGVLLQQYNCLVDAKNICEWYSFSESDKAMLILPIHHVNGIIVTLLTPLYFGGSIVLNEKFSVSNYWETVQDYGCTYGSVVPTILSFLCEGTDAKTAKKVLQQRKNKVNPYFVICGAGPLTVESAKRFDEKFHVKVNHGYGLSETTCYSCYLPFDLNDADYKKWMSDFGYPSIGVALPCNEMDIHDTNGKTVAIGEKGEIVIRGHNVMSCYYRRPDANAEAFKFGWFRSGDEGFYQIDDIGRKFFFITGRLKELIIRGGVNYSPLEIDEVINKVEGVKAGMAVGFENNMYGEEIGAFVVLEPGVTLTEQELLSAFSELPYSKRPKVVIVGENLPVTSTGKYQRNKLKPLFEKWSDTQFRED
tara:strand:- start:83643 stop:85361 length:1719 start_codon:yes stop_codon:yes gene_type:complete